MTAWPKACCLALWAVLLTAALPAPGEPPGPLVILSPSAEGTVFGPGEVVAAWVPQDSLPADLERLEFFLDGRRLGEVRDPLTVLTWSVPFDAGQENAAHDFEVVAYGAQGELARARRTTPALQIDDVLDLTLQQVFLTVTDERGRPVTGLPAGAFRLYDDGVRQQLVTVAGGEVPFSAVILVDASLSMEGQRFQAALAGVRAFADGMRRHDEARLMLFADHLVAAGEFTQDPEVLTAAAARAEPAGGTALNDHLYRALETLEGRLGRQVVILLSDGGDVHSVLDMEQVRQAARRSQATIYWLRLVPGGSRRAAPLYHSFRPPKAIEDERRLLAETVEHSGGRTREVRQLAEITPAFGEILDELRRQVALGYYPDPRHDDGRWRSLRVEVSGPGLVVRLREGYFDD